jgi:hypothetical protein
MLKFSLLGVAVFFVAASTFTQTTATPTTSDPQAVALSMQALTALTGSTQITDVTLTGTGIRTAGSEVESGTVSLKAIGSSQARFDLSAVGGTRSEIRNLYTNNAPQGLWISLDGTVHSMASHNCVTDAAWFFPAFSVISQLSNQNLVATYVGQESKNGVAVQHLHFVVQDKNDPGGLVERLSAEDVYLDASSYLPVAIAFNVHPDDNGIANIPVEIDFSSYQAVNGVRVPYHIQRRLNGTLLFDLTIQSVILNSGLTSAAFSAN